MQRRRNLRLLLQKFVTLSFQCADDRIGNIPMKACLCVAVRDGDARMCVATDSLAASNSLPKLRCVVNPGIGKRPCYRAGMSFLSLCALPKDENRQRHGRAGRTVPGICF